MTTFKTILNPTVENFELLKHIQNSLPCFVQLAEKDDNHIEVTIFALAKTMEIIKKLF